MPIVQVSSWSVVAFFVTSRSLILAVYSSIGSFSKLVGLVLRPPIACVQLHERTGQKGRGRGGRFGYGCCVVWCGVLVVVFAAAVG